MDAGNSEDVAALKAEIEALSQKVDKHKQGYEEMKAAEDADPNTAAALAAEEQGFQQSQYMPSSSGVLSNMTVWP